MGDEVKRCEICGRERTAWAPEKTLGAFAIPWAEAAKCWHGNDGAEDREHWRIGFEREKARADANLLALDVAAQNVAREKARADAATAKAEQYERDWYAAKSEFGDAMAKSHEALAAARRENDDLTGRAMIRNGFLRAALERIAGGTDDPKQVARTALAAPAAGEEGTCK